MEGHIWGRVLGEYRNDNELIKKEVAAKLRITREYYSRVERGKVEPSGKIIHRICKVTGAVVTYPSKNIKDKDIFKIFSTLSDEDKEIIKSMILKMIGRQGKSKP